VYISAIEYDARSYVEREFNTIQECLGLPRTRAVTWLNIDDAARSEVLAEVTRCFPLPPYVLEEVSSARTERPQIISLDDHLFIIVNMLSINPQTSEVEAEQMNLIVGHNVVLSFGEKEGDVFDPVRDRLRNSQSRIRKLKVDYLLYSLLDAIVDNYFAILERVGEMADDLEDQVAEDPSVPRLQVLHDLRSQTLLLRKAVWPLREVLNSLERRESPLISRETQPYFRNLYDHAIQVMETIETLRDTLAQTFDIYLTSVSNRTNDIIKVLTVISTIFIPLTFITGVYGMNFQYVPEFGWRWGYPAAWGVMILIVLIMLLYFRRKGWF